MPSPVAGAEPSSIGDSEEISTLLSNARSEALELRDARHLRRTYSGSMCHLRMKSFRSVHLTVCGIRCICWTAKTASGLIGFGRETKCSCNAGRVRSVGVRPQA
jgi:hypothetical protein